MGPIGGLANFWWKLFTPDMQQFSAPKTVEWLGRYAQFRGIDPICPGEGGGGLHGDDLRLHRFWSTFIECADTEYLFLQDARCAPLQVLIRIAPLLGISMLSPSS